MAKLLTILFLLPIMWIDFSYNQNKQRLEWSTGSEQNNDHFAIEESADGITWYQIGYVPTQAPGGNSDKILTYQFVP